MLDEKEEKRPHKSKPKRKKRKKKKRKHGMPKIKNASQRRAKLIGRDDDTIEKLLTDLNNSPKFAKLCTYSMNCLGSLAENRHNWDGIVQQGGIDCVLNTLRNHMGNPLILKECARVLAELSKDPVYAKMIAESGAIELMLEFMRVNPEECTEDANRLLQMLLKQAPDETAKKIDKSKGVEQMVTTLEKYKGNPVVTSSIAKTLNMLVDVNNDMCMKVAMSGGPKALLEALRMNPEDKDLALNTIEALQKLAKVDESFLDFLRAEGVVAVLAAAMDALAEEEDILAAGTEALRMFADHNDLKMAMDVIGKTAINADSKRAGEALGIVGNLALLPENVDFIVQEGGIPIFLDIMKEATDKMKASAIRAVGRLLESQENARAFEEEGGMELLMEVLKTCGDSEEILSAALQALLHLAATDIGRQIIKDSGILPIAVEVFNEHPEHKLLGKKLMDLLDKIELNDNEMAALMTCGLINGLQKFMDVNMKEAHLAKRTADFIAGLVTNNPMTTPDVIKYMADSLVKALEAHPENEEVVNAVFNALNCIVDKDAGILAKLIDNGFEETVMKIMAKKKVSKECMQSCENWLAALVSDEMIVKTVNDANDAAKNLLRQPTNMELIEKLGSKLRFITYGLCDRLKNQIFIKNGGLEAMPVAIAALAYATQCDQQEEALKEASAAVAQLVGGAGPLQVFESNAIQALLECYERCATNVDLAQNMTDCLLNMLNAPDPDGDMEIALKLLGAGAAASLCSVLHNHPLNGVLCTKAASALGLLAFPDEAHALKVVEAGGGIALVELLDRLVGSDENFIVPALDALLKVADKTANPDFINKHALTNILAFTKVRSPEVLAAVASCLSTLCNNDQLAGMLLDANGALELLEVVKKFNDSPQVLAPTLDALTKMLRHDPKCLKAQDVHDWVMATIKQNPDDLGVMLAGLSCLTALLEGNPESSALLTNEDIQVAQKLVRKFPDSAEAIIVAANFVAALAQDPQKANELLAMGFGDMLLMQKEHFHDNEDVQVAVDHAHELVNPSAKTIIKQIMSGKLSDEQLRTYLQNFMDRLDMGEPLDLPIDDVEFALRALLESDCEPEIKALLGDIIVSLVENQGFTQTFLNSELCPLMFEQAQADPAIAEKLLAMLTKMARLEDNAEMLLKGGVHNQILNIMKTHKDQQSVQLAGLNALNALCANSKDGASKLAESAIFNHLKRILTAFPENDKIGRECVRMLAAMAEKLQAEEMGLLIEGLEELLKSFPENEIIQSACGQLLKTLKPEEDDVKENQLVGIEATEALFGANTLPGLPTDRGDSFDWGDIPDLPADEMLFTGLSMGTSMNMRIDALERFSMLKLTDEEIDGLVQQNAIRKLVGAMKTAAKNNPDLLQRLIDTLELFIDNDGAFSEIVSVGGIAALLRAMRMNMDCVEVLIRAIRLLGRLAKNDHMKTLIGMQGAIQLIFQCMKRHPDHSTLQEVSLSCINNLALKNPGNNNLVISDGGLPIAIDIIRRHLNNAYVCQPGIELLSNLTYEQDTDNKILICMSGGSSIILDCLTTHQDNTDVVMSAVKALGNMSFANENIPQMIKEKILTIFLTTMTNHVKDMSVISTCVSVLGNIATDRTHSPSFIDEGIVDLFCGVSVRYRNQPALLTHILRCLGNIASVPSSATRIIKKSRAHEIVFNVLKDLDWSEKCVDLALQLLRLFASHKTHSEYLLREGAAKYVLSVMKTNRQNVKLLRLACQCLTKLLCNQKCAVIVQNHGIVDMLSPLMAEVLDKPLLVVDIMKVFKHMCSHEVNAQAIAKTTTKTIIMAMDYNVSNPSLITTTANLIASLALYRSSSKYLGQQGTPRALKHTIINCRESHGVVAKLIRALKNLILCDKGSYHAVEALEIEQLVNEIRRANRKNTMLQRSCKEFLIALKQRRQDPTDLKSKKQTMSFRDRLDPGSMRTLTGGSIMRKFCRNSKPRKRRIRCSNDCMWLILEDIAAKKQAKRLDLLTVTDIRPGLCSRALNRKSAKADPERSFGIFFTEATGDEDVLSLETPGRREPWIKAFRELIDLLSPERRHAQKIAEIQEDVLEEVTRRSTKRHTRRRNQ